MKRVLLAFLAIPLLCGWPSMLGGNGTGGGGGGGGGGAFTFVASASGAADSAGTTVSTSSTLNVATGDLLIAVVTFEDDDSTTTVSITDGGSNSLTFDSGDDLRDGTFAINVHPLYRLSGVANATATFTATLSASRSWKRIVVMQYRPGSGETVTKDVSGTRENSGTGTSLASGSFSTTGTDGVVCGLSGIYTTPTFSSAAIGGVSADQTKQQGGAYAWCRIVTAGLTTQTATVTSSSSSIWAATVLAFKSE